LCSINKGILGYTVVNVNVSLVILVVDCVTIIPLSDNSILYKLY
jgi:hypothetical protein